MPLTLETPRPKDAAPPRILKKLAYLLSARWLREAMQAAFLIYLARHSATTYGEFSLALGLGSILLLVSEFGLNLPLVSLLAKKDGDKSEALSQVSFLKGGLLALSLTGAVVFVHWQNYPLALQRLVLLLSAGVGVEALANSFFVALQVQGRQDLQGKIKAMAAFLGFGFGLAVLVAGAPPLLVAAYKLIESLVNIAGSVTLVRAGQAVSLRLPSLRRLWSTLRLGMVFALIEVAAIIYNKANLFFLQKYAGAGAVAQYSVTWQTVDGISVLVTNILLQSILYPLFVQFWEHNREKVPALAQNTARWLMGAAISVMFVLFIESDRLILMIYGRHYQEAVWVQKCLVATVAFAFLHNLAAFLMISMRLQRLLLSFYLVGLAVNLLWCSLFIPASPLLGAALAMVVTKGLVALLTVGYCQQRLGLFPRRSLVQLGGATALGLILYLGGKIFLPRAVAEALFLVPQFTLAWNWWRGQETV